MTRSELAILSQAHAVAYAAMAAHEICDVPMAAAWALHEAATVEFPDFAPRCWVFVDALRESHGVLSAVEVAGRHLRDSVSRAMAFVPRDLHRVDLHG